MSDPISPVGSPGQLPATATSAAIVSGIATSGGAVRGDTQVPVTKGTAQAANPDGNSKGTSRGEQAPVTLEDAAKILRDHLKNVPSDLLFSKDEATGKTVFKVVNPVTQEVIRQYPPDELLEMAKRLKQVDQGDGAGILLDQKM